jgi:hypothetical protein
MRINEQEMLKMLDKAKNVLLVEPNYPRKHAPLGLCKIKTYLENQGKEADYARQILPKKYDLICVTTLFTYYSKHVFEILKHRGLFNSNTPILIGGVMASLIPEEFDKFPNTHTFVGYSQTLDKCIPHRSLIDILDPPFNEYSYINTSRGCPNKCSYCAVWRIEQPIWLNPTWEQHIFLDKPYIMISDNNISSISYEHVKQIVDIAIKYDKKLYFNNGLDCKHIDTKMAELLAKAKYVTTGLRTAFDRIEEDGTFQPAIEKLIKAGVPPSNIQAYILFNYTDKPKDADFRARTCADFRITPYPQFYTKLNALSKKKKYVGKYWTLGLANTFRFFWLLRGHYYKYTFDEFLKMRRTREHFHLTDHDIAVWDSNGAINVEKKRKRKIRS